MLLTLLVGAVTLLVIWDFVRKRHSCALLKRSGIKGPLCLPLVGCALQFWNVCAENMDKMFLNCFEKYGKTFHFWILNESQLFTKDLSHFEDILSSTTLLEKGQVYRFILRILDDGVLLSVGKKWNARRKIFTHAFKFNVFDSFLAIMDRESGIFVEKLEHLATGEQVVNMQKYVALAALDIITEAALGVQLHAQSELDNPYVMALKSAIHIQTDRMIKTFQRFDWLFRLTCPLMHQKLVSDIRIMNDFTDKVIRERRTKVERSKADGSYKPFKLGDAEIGSKSKMVLLDLLLDASFEGVTLTDRDIREEVNTILFAGDDTISSVLSHAFYCIARHPIVQAKIYEELEEVLGKDRTAPVSQTQLQELRYLECVIKETMRLHTPVPLLGRYTHTDLQIGQLTIPANTSIYLLLYFVHRDPDNFPEPLSFKPERFLVNTEERHKFSYLPFSAGPKNCFGQKFAMLEMKTLISKVLRYYELLPKGPELKFRMNFILGSTTGMNVALKPRLP